MLLEMLKNTPKLIISIALCEIVGIIGSVFTVSSIETWYRFLNKPEFSPPNWVFGPVWTMLYALMGVSLYLIWNRGLKSNKTKYAIKIFFVQLTFNFFWSIAFFGLQNPLLALIVIVLLWASILYTILLFKKISQIAGLLLLPYILWVSFAVLLNLSIVLLN